MHKLYLQQKIFKITDHYEVYDDSGNAVYQVDQDFKFIGNTVHVRKFDGTKGFVIDRKILTLLPRYIITFDDGKVLRVKQNLTFFKKSIDLISDDYDLNLRGNFLDMDFEIFERNRVVGRIYKKYFTFRDIFVLEIIEDEYEDEILALTIVVDEIKDIEAANN
ncbi:MAG: LURP-one-related family protein [Helcococcus sp.]|nr:LURP-one-related family protein [Helcococcus sp.]